MLLLCFPNASLHKNRKHTGTKERKKERKEERKNIISTKTNTIPESHDATKFIITTLFVPRRTNNDADCYASLVVLLNVARRWAWLHV